MPQHPRSKHITTLQHVSGLLLLNSKSEMMGRCVTLSRQCRLSYRGIVALTIEVMKSATILCLQNA